MLTRAERIQRLKAADRWKEGDSPFGLSKVRVYKLAVKKKKKKKEEEGAEGAEAAAAAPAAEWRKEAGEKKLAKKELARKRPARKRPARRKAARSRPLPGRRPSALKRAGRSGSGRLSPGRVGSLPWPAARHSRCAARGKKATGTVCAQHRPLRALPAHGACPLFPRPCPRPVSLLRAREQAMRICIIGALVRSAALPPSNSGGPRSAVADGSRFN